MPNANEEVIITYGTQSEFNELENKNENTIYFIIDTKRIYVGNTEYTEDTNMNSATKQYIDDAIGGITEFDYQVVTSLPQTGTKGVIYLVLHEHGANDTYDEYLWIGNKFEKIGNTDIDLTQYVKNTDSVSLTAAEYDALTEKTAKFYYIIEEE